MENNVQQTDSASTKGMPKNQRVATVLKRNGTRQTFQHEKIIQALNNACGPIAGAHEVATLYDLIHTMLFDGITAADIQKSCILAAASCIEQDPVYDTIATRLMIQQISREASNGDKQLLANPQSIQQLFVTNIMQAVQWGLLDRRLLSFPLEELAFHLKPERDYLFEYMGLQTLYQRYLLRHHGAVIETPQIFWMRLAMGLSLQEEHKFERALEFYETMSTLSYVPSTPTLFHAGFPVAQLSSCYLTTVEDDLLHIFKCMSDNAQLSKWAGGIGTDWTAIRGTGAYIKGIKATSQGVIPYLKIANDVVIAITKSGIRRGGKCAYLETWHIDIEDFLDLRRNTGDERRRTHDMNTANWIPDLFMKRVMNDEMWTLFSPDETPDLHEIYGTAFETRYIMYEKLAQDGALKHYRQISARTLWRKMLTRIFETGHPWITFKDPCNIRSPQDHVGVVHSSNLCTEITLNTSAQETAVCNLGSVNLAQHITASGEIDIPKLYRTISTAVRMLDNVIDLNFYPTIEAKTSNLRHRPIGLGVMGFQDALFKLNVPFSSRKACELADIIMEHISYAAISASCDLAKERGAYSSFPGSKWDRGIFPYDTLALLEAERGSPIEVSRDIRLDWTSLKQKVHQYGMRNSNTMAIAPTATIATIAGCFPSIEPPYRNIYVKSNVSGEFTVVNKYLIAELKAARLWNQNMLDQLKYYDGNLSMISSIPADLQEKYKTAFDHDQEWLITITATRGKWIDQSQSHNIFMKGVSGKQLEAIYMKAWRSGLKTTYYLRTLGATQIEKATLDSTYGFTQKRTYVDLNTTTEQKRACGINDTECESCQ